jgi:hypothetical protein
MLVTDASAAPTYTVTRDLVDTYSSNNNPIWKKGTAVVSVGVGGASPTGYILLDSSSTNSPYIDVYQRQTVAWYDYILKARLGWLKGIVDTSVGLNNNDVWGLYSESVYLKGTIVASSGAIGGFLIGADYIRDAADSFGLSSVVASGNDVRFWAGSTFATKESAPFSVDEAGNAIVSSLRRNDFHIFSSFESIDGYRKNDTAHGGGDGTIVLTETEVNLTTGAISSNTVSMNKTIRTSTVNEFSWSKPRSFQTTVQIPTGGTADVNFFIGTGKLNDGNEKQISFVSQPGFLFGFVANGTSNSSVSILSGGLTAGATFLLKFVYTGTSVKFYVNNALSGTITTNLPNSSAGESNSNIIFNTLVQTSADLAKTVLVSSYDFWQGV